MEKPADLKLFTSSKIKGTGARGGRHIPHTRLEVINLFRGGNWSGGAAGPAEHPHRPEDRVSTYTACFHEITAARGAEERRRANEDIRQLKLEDRSSKVAAISRSSRPSRVSDLFSFNFLHQDYLPK